jgi:vacuolar-type H+-ATPase catalytic subunit A/Vma1
MNAQHKDLAAGRWNSLSFCEQMANVGSEVERAIKWREKRNAQYSQMAFERALELLDLTVADEKNKKRLKELLRLREMLADYFVFENVYQSSDRSFQNYFSAFNFAARRGL